jgi:hypothetical protein
LNEIVAGPDALGKRRKAYRVLPTKGDVRCKIEGCLALCDTPYSARVKVCSLHTKISQVQLEGVASRFCHKHNKFHTLDSFTGKGHTCSVWLARLREEYQERGGSKRKASTPASLERGSATDTTDSTTVAFAAASGDASYVAVNASGGASAAGAHAYDSFDSEVSHAEVSRASDDHWARMTADLCGERTLSQSSIARSHCSLGQQPECPTGEKELDLFGDDFCHILEHFDNDDGRPHQRSTNGDAHLATTFPQSLAVAEPPRSANQQLRNSEHLQAASIPGAAEGDFMQKSCYNLMSFWIKLHGFTPNELPTGGMREMLAHWMLARPVALSSSAQPGCTLLKFDFLLPEDVAAKVRARGVSELAALVGQGPLGARGDYTVGIDGAYAQATVTHGGGGVAGRGKQVGDPRAFTISTLSSSSGDVPDRDSSSSLVPASVSVTELQVVSEPCVCSLDRGGEGVPTVVVQLPHPLPDGGRIECRVRGRTIPVILAEVVSSRNSAGNFDAHVVIPATGLNGAAMLEMVHGDGTPCGAPAAVLVFATDPLLVSAMNTVRR